MDHCTEREDDEGGGKGGRGGRGDGWGGVGREQTAEPCVRRGPVILGSPSDRGSLAAYTSSLPPRNFRISVSIAGAQLE